MQHLSVSISQRRDSFQEQQDLERKQSVVAMMDATPNASGPMLVSAAGAPAAETKPTKPVRARPKILFLDGLRGLAAMLVVTQHMGIMGDRNFGAAAVDTFFVLSSFLLTMILEKKTRSLWNQRTTKRTWVFTMIDYFARRLLRVYPLFVLISVVLWIMPDDRKKQYFVSSHPENFNLFKVLTFSFEFRYHVFWTLPLEITYYFVIPFVVFAVLILGKRWWWPMIPAMGWICYEGVYMYRWDHLGLRPHFPTFLAGSIGAIVFNRLDAIIKDRDFVFPKWLRVLIRTVEYVTLAILLSICFQGLVFDWVFANPAPKTSGSHFVSVPVTFLMVCELLLPGPLSRGLEWNLLRYAGKVSYSMYLEHSFVLYSRWIPTSYYDRFFAVFGLTFLLSSISYQLVEYPMQKVAGYVGAWCKKNMSTYEPVQMASARDQSNLEAGFITVAQTPSAAATPPAVDFDKDQNTR